MSKKVFIQSSTTETVDPSTGELKIVETSKIHKIVLDKSEEFFQVYCKFIASVYELKYADDIKLLIKFCEIAEFNTGKVLVPTPTRKRLCEEIGLQSSNVSKSIRRLKEKGLLQGEKGEYLINPAIFWKGEKKMRDDLLKGDGLSVTLNFKKN